MPSRHRAACERPAVNPWIIALTVTLATFMEVLDTSVANVALPHIAGSLSAGQDESTWVLTSYLVSNAIVLPMSGWFSSLIGRKRFYMSCVALFTISSFFADSLPALGMLIFFRVLQGVGRRRTAAERASDSGGHVSAEASADGVRRLRHGGGAGAGHRADARRMDHRQFQLALDFLHQYSRRNHFAVPHEPADHRSPVHEGRKTQGIQRRLHRLGTCWRSASARCKWCWIRASATIGSARTSSWP